MTNEQIVLAAKDSVDTVAVNIDGEVKVLRCGTCTGVSTGSDSANWYSVTVNPTSNDVWSDMSNGGEIKVLRESHPMNIIKAKP